MRVWLDVYDADLNRDGNGPVWAVKSAQVKRNLDGAGSWRANCVATDPQALLLLAPNKVVKLWRDEGTRETKRLLGEGIITNWQFTEDPTGVGLIVDGPDLLEELKRKNTLLGRIYNQQTVAAVVSDLIGLAPGWSADVDSSIVDSLVDARFDGVSVLKALLEIAKRYGFHVRASLTTSRRVEIGPFETDSGLNIHKTESLAHDAQWNNKLLMVQRIKYDQRAESGDYFNVIIPTGGGEGTAALTLAESTRSSPYPVQSITGPDGRTVYYMATTNYPSNGYADFRADPGAVVLVGQYKEVNPLSNSEADIVNATNALYDGAAEDLTRGATIQETYSVTVKNAQESVLPGDLVHLNYKGTVPINGIPTPYLTIRGDYVVLTATEQISPDGSDVALEISNIDRVPVDEVEMVFNAIESMSLRSLKPNPNTGGPAPYVYSRDIAPNFPVSFPIEVTDKTLKILRVRLRIETTPFRATTTGAASGGASSETSAGSAHAHIAAVRDTSGGHSFSTRQYRMPNNEGGFVYFQLSTDPDGDDLDSLESFNENPAHTHDLNLPAHTHDLVYAVTDDDQYPTGIAFWFEGADVTNTLFGAATLAPSGGAINQLADAGELANLLADASGGLRQQHKIEIRCASGQGRVEITVERFDSGQAI